MMPRLQLNRRAHILFNTSRAIQQRKVLLIHIYIYPALVKNGLSGFLHNELLWDQIDANALCCNG